MANGGDDEDCDFRLVAELSCFSMGMQPDPTDDEHLFDKLERMDAHSAGYRDLARRMVRCEEPRIRRHVDRIVAANP